MDLVSVNSVWCVYCTSSKSSLRLLLKYCCELVGRVGTGVELWELYEVTWPGQLYAN